MKFENSLTGWATVIPSPKEKPFSTCSPCHILVAFLPLPLSLVSFPGQEVTCSRFQQCLRQRLENWIRSFVERRCMFLVGSQVKVFLGSFLFKGNFSRGNNFHTYTHTYFHNTLIERTRSIITFFFFGGGGGVILVCGWRDYEAERLQFLSPS